MKPKYIFAIVALGIWTAFCFAEIDTPLPTESWLLAVLTFLTTVKGQTVLAIVAGVVQLVMKFFNTPLSNFAGKTRLLIVTFLSLVGTVVGGMATGLTFLQSLATGASLAAFQVFVNQLWKQFVEKADETIVPTVRR